MFSKWFFYFQQMIFVFSKWLLLVQRMIFIFSKRLCIQQETYIFRNLKFVFSNIFIFNSLRFGCNKMKFVQQRSLTFSKWNLDKIEHTAKSIWENRKSGLWNVDHKCFPAHFKNSWPIPDMTSKAKMLCFYIISSWSLTLCRAYKIPQDCHYRWIRAICHLLITHLNLNL